MLLIRDDQYAVISAMPVNRRKAEAQIDGGISWKVIDESIVKILVAGDGLSAKVIPCGVIGETEIEASADAELGSGMHKIFAKMQVKVVSGAAFSVTMTVLKIQDQQDPNLID